MKRNLYASSFSHIAYRLSLIAFIADTRYAICDTRTAEAVGEQVGVRAPGFQPEGDDGAGDEWTRGWGLIVQLQRLALLQGGCEAVPDLRRRLRM